MTAWALRRRSWPIPRRTDSPACSSASRRSAEPSRLGRTQAKGPASWRACRCRATLAAPCRSRQTWQRDQPGLRVIDAVDTLETRERERQRAHGHQAGIIEGRQLVRLDRPQRIEQARHPQIAVQLLVEDLLDTKIAACALAIGELSPRQRP